MGKAFRFKTPSTEKHNGIRSGIEMGEAFRLKAPSTILIVGPSGRGKTCLTKSLFLDHFEVAPPPASPPYGA